MSYLIKKILQERYISNQYDNYEDELNESRMTGIASEPVGATIHPILRRGFNSVTYSRPLTVVKHLQTKTILKSDDGAEHAINHRTGILKKHGNTYATSTHGYHSPAEMSQETIIMQHKKDRNDAALAIHSHLHGLTNAGGNVVGKLSDEDHAAILKHLDKLRN